MSRIISNYTLYAPREGERKKSIENNCWVEDFPCVRRVNNNNNSILKRLTRLVVTNGMKKMGKSMCEGYISILRSTEQILLDVDCINGIELSI